MRSLFIFCCFILLAIAVLPAKALPAPHSGEEEFHKALNQTSINAVSFRNNDSGEQQYSFQLNSISAKANAFRQLHAFLAAINELPFRAFHKPGIASGLNTESRNSSIQQLLFPKHHFW